MYPLEWLDLSRLEKAILNMFHGFASRKQTIRPRQSWIAKALSIPGHKCWRESVCRAIAKLVAQGFIAKEKRRSRGITYIVLKTLKITSQITSQITSRAAHIGVTWNYSQDSRESVKTEKPGAGMPGADGELGRGTEVGRDDAAISAVWAAGKPNLMPWRTAAEWVRDAQERFGVSILSAEQVQALVEAA